jgi:hypothetical protein
MPGRRPAVSARAFGLRTRVGLVFGGALVLAVMIATAWWVQETRRAIGEEVTAASRVAEQWLNVLVAETLRDEASGPARLMNHLRAVGRLRANQLEVVGAQGERLYLSPEPTYKAGRFAPAWFAERIAPALPLRRFDAGDRQLVLRPDTSRAVLDAWDDLCAGLGWAAAALMLAGLAAHAALNRALAPLGQIDAALARGAEAVSTGVCRLTASPSSIASPRVTTALPSGSTAPKRSASVWSRTRPSRARSMPGWPRSAASSHANSTTNWVRASPRCARWPGRSYSVAPISRTSTAAPRPSSR